MDTQVNFSQKNLYINCMTPPQLVAEKAPYYSSTLHYSKANVQSVIFDQF